MSAKSVEYALSVYENISDKTKVSFFIFNLNDGNYKFLLSLNLDLDKLVFISYPKNFSIKNPLKILKEKKRINHLYAKYFRDIMHSDIYLFSNVFNWIAFSMAKRLSESNKIFLIDHARYSYQNIPINKSLKAKLVSSIFKFISGVRFRTLIFLNNGKYVLEFCYKEYGINRLEPHDVDTSIYKKYLYAVDGIKQRSIFFIESNLSQDPRIYDYRKKITKVFKIIYDSNYHIYLKPHPRLGYSRFLEKYCEDILPDYIPAEFYCTDSFDAIFSVYSSSLEILSKNKKTSVYSLFDLFLNHNKGEEDNFNYDRGEGYRYVNSLTELEKIFKLGVH